MRKVKGHTDTSRLELLSIYLSGPVSIRTFEKRNGLSNGCIRRWLRTFGLEDKPRIEEMKTRPVSEEDLRKEIESLKLQVKRLEHELKESNMARDANDWLIDLAESKYSLPIRKNSGAK